MSVLLYATLLVAATFFLHILIWKLRRPTHQKSALLAIFGLSLIVGLTVLFIFRHKINLFGVTAPQGFYEYLRLIIFFASLGLAYIVTYSAIEADSPSLVMIMAIAKAGSSGLDEKIFEEKINNDVLIVPRVNDMLSEKLAYLELGRYKLTPKGLLIANTFIAYRKLIRRESKGG